MNLPDAEQFTFKEGIIGGDECILITPNNITCKWSQDTLKFRSIIVRKSDGHIISRGFSKFHNWFEKPDLDKFPDGPFDAIAKMDGSLIIWGTHNGELIHRTRGTFNAEAMANGGEISFLIKKYPLLQAAIKINRDYSILTEWQTPTNVIVINEVDEPTLTLVGVIHNENGKLVSQAELDERSIAWGLNRPTRYHYNSISECIADVEMWTGKEGIVLYSEDGQHLRKIKSEWYCELHKLATGIKNINQVLDVFMVSPKFTKYSEFYSYVETTLDHEIAERVKDDMVKICAAYTKTLEKLEYVKRVVESVKSGFTRKEQALEFQSHWNDWRLAVAFTLLDNKEIPDKSIRTGIETYL